MELREQSLKRDYKEETNKIYPGQTRAFYLNNKILVEENSVFYLTSQGESALELYIGNERYVIPSSDESLNTCIVLGEISEIRSFSLKSIDKENISVIEEIGMLSSEQANSMVENHTLFINEGVMAVSRSAASTDKNISVSFNSGSNSEIENIMISNPILGNYGIRSRKGENTYFFYGTADAPVDALVVETEEVDMHKILFSSEFAIETALPADLEFIYHRDVSEWRRQDYELYDWDLFPGMLIIDTIDYKVQSDLFKRLAFFTEKKGYRGTLVSDYVLEPLHGWNAHDYKAEDLARFFNKALEENFPLNQKEIELKSLLLANGVLIQSDKGERVDPGTGGILSISQESSARLRWIFLAHECYHGIFFISEQYRNEITEIWSGLQEEEREFWRIFLGMYGYDVSHDYLLINEFQAYLMQQNVDAAESYFRGKIRWIVSLRPNLTYSMNQLLLEHEGSFFKSAQAVEESAITLTGIRAGDLVLKRKK